MPEPFGPPTPPNAKQGWNELKKTVTVGIPRRLTNVQHGLAKMRHRRRRG